MGKQSTPSPVEVRLHAALKDVLAHARGELELKTTRVFVDPPEYDAKALTKLRRRADLSQNAFARLLGVTPKTLQSWEQGTRRPSRPARRLLQIYEDHPEVFHVRETVGG